MKKKRLLSGILILLLMFSFVFSSSTMAFAEEYESFGNNARQESIEQLPEENETEKDMLGEEQKVSEDLKVEDNTETEAETGEQETTETDVEADKQETTETETAEQDETEQGTVEDESTETIEDTTEKEIVEEDRLLLDDTAQMRTIEPGYIGWLTRSTTGYKDKLFVAKTGVENTTEVAYCYNFNKTFPGTLGENFSKIANASADDFQNLVGNSRVYGEELKTKILKICYEGYPKNSKSMKERYGLSDDEFCLITQAAVWYYTDSRNVIARGEYYDQATKYRSIVRKDNVQRAFQALINTDIPLPVNYELDLYKPTNGGSRVQNLLSTKIKTDTQKRYEFYLDKRNEANQGLSGAILQFLRGDGSLIQEWTSDGTARLFEAEAGSYIFREKLAPTGYEKANDILFKVDNNGNVTSGNGTIEGSKTVVMVDKQSKPQITISKRDQDGRQLSDAELQILSSDGNKILQHWNTNGIEKVFSIDAGDYIFKEVKAPQGYEKVSDVQFSVDVNGKITIKNAVDHVKAEGNKLIVVDRKEVPKTSVSVAKKWRDAGFEHERPDNIQVQLLADGKPYGDPQTLMKDQNNILSYTWNDLPAQKYNATVQQLEDIVYTIKEVDTKNQYIVDIKNGKGDAEAVYKNYTFVLTNIKPIDLTLSKEVTGQTGDKRKKFTFEISILYDGYLPYTDQIVEFEGSVLPGYENEVTAPQNGTVEFKNGKATISLSHGQQIKLKGLIYHENLICTMKEVEANQDGYKTTYNGQPATEKGVAVPCNDHITLKVVNDKGGRPPVTGISEGDRGTKFLIGMSVIGFLLIAVGSRLRFRKGIK